MLYEQELRRLSAKLWRSVSSYCRFTLSLPTAVTLFYLVSGLQAQNISPAQIQRLTLQQCLQTAREKNHSRPASQFAVAIAEAEHRQALSGYWPQINARGGVERTDEPFNFLFPASQMYIPAQSVSIPGGQAMVTIPANAFGPGFPPSTIQLPVAFPAQTIQTSAQQFPIPAQNIKLMNPTTSSVSGDFKFLLFDGGMRHGLNEQSLGGIDAAKADAHRTDLEVSDSVTRLYYGAVLARQLRNLGKDTLDRMETTLQLTESLYKSGAGTVTKADYLDNKVIVETIRSMVAQLEGNESSAEAALAYTVGLSWTDTVEPADSEIPFLPVNGTLDELVASAYEFNPDWAKVEAGLRAFNGERRTAESGYSPKLAITGEVHRFWNSYDSGISTPQNRAGWSVGAGVEIPIFDGFLTSGRVAEAQARINKLKEEKILLREGIGLQLRELFLQLSASEKTYRASLDAMTAAQEDSDLTTRGYGAGLLTTEKVIRAQLQEALISAQYYKAAFDHRALQSQIDLTVGKEVQATVSRIP
jgi:outer membrane protein TolC